MKREKRGGDTSGEAAEGGGKVTEAHDVVSIRFPVFRSTFIRMRRGGKRGRKGGWESNRKKEMSGARHRSLNLLLFTFSTEPHY